MADLYAAVYNPDVLSCLANLSNDEVFTPPEMANQVLDMLPESLWSDPNAKFLDPCCKTGIFLREIAKRLIRGQIPDFDSRMAQIDHKRGEREELSDGDKAFLDGLQPVIDHIFKEQLYGIGITELTSLMTRRSLYCSKWANGPYSVAEFSTTDGNIRFRRIEHSWVGKKGKEKCLYCGASKKELEDGRTSDETHAYELIHVLKPEELFDMQFDVIVGNPPYQLNDGGNAASAMPIYQKFVQQAQKLNPRYLTMIIPARWYMGGRGLDQFRAEMLHDDRIRELHDFPNASDCFPGVEIKGGVCYFLWSRDDRGLCKVFSHEGNTVASAERPLLEKGMDTFIRSGHQISILEKVKAKHEATLSEVIQAGRFFGFHTRVKWEGDKGSLQTADGSSSFPVSKNRSDKFDTKVYIAHGECWIERKNVVRNASEIDKYKVLIPRSGNPGGSILGRIRLSEPGSCSSNTYNVLIAEKGREEADNLVEYIKTKFVRYLVATRTATQDTAPKSFEFVPQKDQSKRWTDEMLFDYYGLSEEEIDAIESSIPEMS